MLVFQKTTVSLLVLEISVGVRFSTSSVNKLREEVVLMSATRIPVVLLFGGYLIVGHPPLSLVSPVEE